MSIYKKIHEAKKAIGVVAKNAKNPHFKNTYADINALISEVEPILIDNGLVLLQPIRDGKQYTEIHDIESGETVESFIELNSSLPPQAMGSAITYFRRYTLQSLLSLRADDDDGQKASAQQPTQKPNFIQANFESAYKKGSKLEEIKKAATVTKEVEQAYIDYVIEQDKLKLNA